MSSDFLGARFSADGTQIGFRVNARATAGSRAKTQSKWLGHLRLTSCERQMP